MRRIVAACILDSCSERVFHHHHPLFGLQVVREGSKRVLGLRPFDVQLIGGMILHEGQIAEMRTGEGKTLVAVLPAYLNALTGACMHVHTMGQQLHLHASALAGRGAQTMHALQQASGCSHPLTAILFACLRQARVCTW